ncbi:protein PHYTOCHROME KINASE SUBSTRATE 1-like [Bidens hawaiensis]|uniref:protein PHYTOCHROME KINASE SUBSTRATE 1-like n=1 Tax=Bidens hawaiensis TaxID=980011 RepID=UPI00404AB536
MITSDKRVSLFGKNVDLHDASFSSYLNHDNSSAMVLKLTHPSHISSKKKVEDGEIGIFGAEKYFKGAMDEQVSRTPNSMIKPTNFHHPKDQQEKDKGKDEDEERAKPKTGSVTPSVRSEASWNSRSGLLANNGNGNGNGNRTSHSSKREKTSAVKSLFISLGCNCNDNKSVKITENKVLVKEPLKPPVKAVLTGGFTDESQKEDCFTFPVINACPMVKNEVSRDDESEIIHVKTRRNSSEAFGSPVLEKGKKSFSLERKLTMLNWEGVTPRVENLDINIGENNDVGSDASSDLFEIESFSTNGNNSFLARQVSNGRSSNATLPNGYAPSEASIAWSVVTTSVAGYSIISDYEDTKLPKNQHMTLSRNGKGGSGDMERIIKGGILSGCNSHKSVRVSGEHMVMGGGEKASVVLNGAMKDRCRLDSIVPLMKFQTETKPLSSFPRGHSQSPRASHHLYIQ